MKKINESTSDEEISSSNEIIDVSKECCIINNSINASKSMKNTDNIMLLKHQKSESINLLSVSPNNEQHLVNTKLTNSLSRNNNNNLLLLPNYDETHDSNNVYLLNNNKKMIMNNDADNANSSSLLYINNTVGGSNSNNEGVGGSGGGGGSGRGTVSIYSSPKMKIKTKISQLPSNTNNNNDDIYGFGNEYQSTCNNLSTFQNKRTLTSNDNQIIINHQYHQPPQLHQATIQDVSCLMNNTKQSILNTTTTTNNNNNNETFTSKLPPVPKRINNININNNNNNSKNNINSSYGSLPKNSASHHQNTSPINNIVDHSSSLTMKKYNHKI